MVLRDDRYAWEEFDNIYLFDYPEGLIWLWKGRKLGTAGQIIKTE